MKILDAPVISNVRRNHALEHASINILTKKNPNLRILGYSDPGGFWLHTDLSTEEVAEAVTEALDRLLHGESELAYHPNCGTNFAVSGIAAGLGAFVGMWGVGSRTKDKLLRLPLVAMLATLALIFTRPLGRLVQQNISISPNPGSLRITQITRTMLGDKIVHRISTKG